MRNFRSLVMVLATMVVTPAAMADSIVISGNAFGGSNVVYGASGTGSASYNAAAPGYASLATGSSGDLNLNDAVVGLKGPLGTLSNLSMSFTVLDQSGVSNQPYAAFGLDAYGDGSHTLLVISLDSTPDLNGSTSIHVFDLTTQAEAANTTWGETLAQLYGQTYSNGTSYGDMTVQRAYVYIGDWDTTGAKTADIGSITITAVPLPSAAKTGLATLAVIAAASLLHGKVRGRPRIA